MALDVDRKKDGRRKLLEACVMKLCLLMKVVAKEITKERR